LACTDRQRSLRRELFVSKFDIEAPTLGETSELLPDSLKDPMQRRSLDISWWMVSAVTSGLPGS